MFSIEHLDNKLFSKIQKTFLLCILLKEHEKNKLIQDMYNNRTFYAKKAQAKRIQKDILWKKT